MGCKQAHRRHRGNLLAATKSAWHELVWWGAGDVGEHKTSMLQDLERGRSMEIDALVMAVQELGRLTDKPTPTIDAVLALLRRLAVERGCYG